MEIGYFSQQQSQHRRTDACYFGRALRRLINWAVAARKLYPKKRIPATKLDVKAAYQRCHLNAMIAIQTCTQLPSEGLALLMLRLTFGGAPCPSEWGSIAESICDLANAILLGDDGILYPSNRQLSILYQTRSLWRMASLSESEEIS